MDKFSVKCDICLSEYENENGLKYELYLTCRQPEYAALQNFCLFLISVSFQPTSKPTIIKIVKN